MNRLPAPPLNAEIVCVPPAGLAGTGSRARRILALAQSQVSGLPAKFQFQYSNRTLARVKQLLREQDFDLILLNGSDLLWMLPHLPAGPSRLLLAHNIEHLLYADQLDFHYPHPGLRQAFLLRDCAPLREHELASLRAGGPAGRLSPADEDFAPPE